MSFLTRQTLRAGLLVTLLLATGSATPATDNLAAPGGESPSARLPDVQVRLRKLHLVRPDLIPYPIAYEVVC